MTRIKICGLSRMEDMAFVNDARPDYCGFVIDFPKSRRNVTADQARRLREKLDPAILPAGVFVNAPAEAVAALLNDGTLSIAQFHGQEDEAYLSRLRALAPGKELWKAFVIRKPKDLEPVRSSSAHRVLLDNGYGTGAAFDWTLIRDVERPWILAGGLTPENLPEAVSALHPWGVDLSSGVETAGVKDYDKIRAAVQAVRAYGGA